eukprot:gb/GECG01010436.1/.p1 GENE.gb/GECG01010436.1/~~gb/GECG01010436.1/.p1  ORF type:complete len:670 (+),score=41.14 gb/GECG01010436.1/:1-2010(+)
MNTTDVVIDLSTDSDDEEVENRSAIQRVVAPPATRSLAEDAHHDLIRQIQRGEAVNADRLVQLSRHERQNVYMSAVENFHHMPEQTFRLLIDNCGDWNLSAKGPGGLNLPMYVVSYWKQNQTSTMNLSRLREIWYNILPHARKDPTLLRQRDNRGRNIFHWICRSISLLTNHADLQQLIFQCLNIEPGLATEADDNGAIPLMALFEDEQLIHTTWHTNSSGRTSKRTLPCLPELKQVLSCAASFQQGKDVSASFYCGSSGSTVFQKFMQTVVKCAQEDHQARNPHAKAIPSETFWSEKYSFRDRNLPSIYHCLVTPDRDFGAFRDIVLCLTDEQLFGDGVLKHRNCNERLALLDIALSCGRDPWLTVAGQQRWMTPWFALCTLFREVVTNPRELAETLEHILSRIPGSYWDLSFNTLKRTPTMELVRTLCSDTRHQEYLAKLASVGVLNSEKRENRLVDRRYWVMHFVRTVLKKGIHFYVNVNTPCIRGKSVAQTLIDSYHIETDPGVINAYKATLKGSFLRGAEWGLFQNDKDLLQSGVPESTSPKDWYQHDQCVVCYDNEATVGVFPSKQIQYCRACAHTLFGKLGTAQTAQHPSLRCSYTQTRVDCYVELRGSIHTPYVAPFRFIPPYLKGWYFQDDQSSTLPRSTSASVGAGNNRKRPRDEGEGN